MRHTLLSIVVAVRNDNYGGDFNYRLQNFIKWNSRLLEEYKVPTEIILVNWNPLLNAPPLTESITLPVNLSFVKFRMLTVSPEIHTEYCRPEMRFVVPMFEFIAKNVGIRHARGEFILCTNADVLVHPEIIRFISAGQLNSGCFYRAHRLDFSKTQELSVTNFFEKATVVSLVAFAYWFGNSFIPKTLQFSWFKLYNNLRIWFEMFRFRNRFVFEKLRVSVTYDNAAFYCHCNTSGDFMLMHHTHWHFLKGYPEETYVSTHTDSLFTFMAYAHLKREHVFGAPVFHQEHERRYTWKAIETDSKFSEMFNWFQQQARQMLKLNSAIVYNNNDWGLNSYTVEETAIGKE